VASLAIRPIRIVPAGSAVTLASVIQEPETPPGAAHPWGNAATPYEELGGAARLRLLVDRFYDLIHAGSPRLHAMHPADDSNSRRNLFEFLSGWMGGPSLYVARKGNPMLRMRHLPFSIGSEEAAEWLRCMRDALEEADVHQPLRGYLDSRLEATALHMRNRPDPDEVR
jgi:hemoglobin